LPVLGQYKLSDVVHDWFKYMPSNVVQFWL
jgi:hypothetical protein